MTQTNTAPNSSPTSEETSEPKALQHVGLTHEQQKKWDDTMSMMVWTAPGFQHLLYRLLNAQSNTSSKVAAIISKECGNACTDGKNVIINPDWYFGLSLPERVFVLGHEIVHNVYGDVELLHRCKTTGRVPCNGGGDLPLREDIMQKSMDFRINQLLIESKIGKPPKDSGNFDPETAATDSVLDIYKRVYEKEVDDEQGPGPGGNPGGFDNLMAPGAATGQNPTQQPRNPQQWAVEVAAAQTIEHARSQGRMAGALKRMFQQILEPEIPWIEHIETLINRTVGDGGIDWTQPHPYWGAYDFFVPGETGKGAGWIVVWGDTSGSRDDQELASNMAELAGIMEAVNPQRLTVLWCDADVDYVDEISDPMDLATIQARGTGGGGGTDYSPVIDWIRENGEGQLPDLFIGFTDGYVSFPKKEHPFPTIWASSTDKAYPFGQVVRINSLVRA